MIFLQEYQDELNSYVLKNEKLFAHFKNKKFFITGAAGLIGSYLIDLIITANKTFDLNAFVYALDCNKALLDERFPDEFNKLFANRKNKNERNKKSLSP